MSRFCMLGFSLVLCSASSALGQTVWYVSASNGVTAAINAAAPGDIIDLTGSSFDSFTVNKGVIIRGNNAVVTWQGQGLPGTVTLNVPAGQIAHVEQLTAAVMSVQGSVRLMQCRMKRISATNADLVIANCIVSHSLAWEPPAAGLQVSGGSVSMRDSTFEGNPAEWVSVNCNPLGCFNVTPLAPNAAMTIAAARIHAERCTFVGGNGAAMFHPQAGPVAFAPQPAVVGWPTQVSFAQCTLRGGDGHAGDFWSAPAPGAPAYGGSNTAYRNTILTTGGPNSTSVTMTTAPLVTLNFSGLWQRGSTSTLSVAGLPNEPHAVFVTTAITAQTLPIVVEAVYASGAFTAFVGIHNGTGLATYQVAVPNVPSLLHTPVWCQAVGGVNLPLRASVLAGGLVR